MRLKHKRTKVFYTFYRSGPAGKAPYGLQPFAGARYQLFQQLEIRVIGFGGHRRDFSEINTDRNTTTLVNVNINIYIYILP